MTETITHPALQVLGLLQSLVRGVPRHLVRDFRALGVTFRSSMLEPITRRSKPARRVCTGLTLRGTPCKNRACEGHDMCQRHLSYRKCTATTAKGTPCKCSTHKGLDMCWRHAKSAGLVSEVNECAVCYTELTSANRVKIKCGHAFCRGCLESWASSKGTSHGRNMLSASCPMCRATFRIKAPVPTWYTHGGSPPTYETSGFEWMQRLRIVPTDATWTESEVERFAFALGQRILSLTGPNRYPTASELQNAFPHYGFRASTT